MSSNRLKELVARYESIQSGGGESLYFDTDEIVEIAEHYEAGDDFAKVLQVVEFGLMLHPGSDVLKLKQAKALLFLERIDEVHTLMGTILDEGVEATLIRAELQYFDNDSEAGHRLLLSLLNHKEVWEDECFDALDIYIHYNHFEGMEEFVARAEARLPDPRGLWREVAAAYEETDNHAAAVKFYNRLLDRDPYSFIDWFALAKVEAMARRYDQALEACDFALAIQENDESVLLFKGYCYYDSGRYAQAVEQFLESLEFTSQKSVVYELIGECYIKSEEPARALEYFGKALALDGNNANLHYQMATCHYDLGNTPQAVIALYETLKLDEMDDEAHSFLGEILLQQGENETAYYHLKRSLEILPNDEETLRFFCDACIQLNRFDEAIPPLEAVLQHSPYDLNARFNLIVAYAHQSEIEKAEELIALIDNQIEVGLDNTQLTDEDRLQWNKAQDMLQSLKKLLLDNLDNPLTDL